MLSNNNWTSNKHS